MSYPGNPSLASDTRDRILSTYRQTLDLAGDGRIQEAALGCDFILKMDPQFGPAGTLQSRLEGASGAIEVSDLVSESQAWSVDDNGGAPPPPASPEQESPVAAALAAPDDLLAPELSDALTNTADADTNSFSIDASSQEQGSSGEEPRIQELLDEGEVAFGRGDYQAAIDSWSRIFLIDIDHDLANRRIEEARKLKAEGERQVEELYNQALDAIDSGDRDGAKALLEQVLTVQPGHLGAKEYLSELDRPEAAAPPPPPPGAAAPGPAPPLGDGALPDIGDDLPPLDDEPATVAPSPVATKASGRRGVDRSLLLIGVGVLGIVLAGAWFLLSNWGNLFPNSDEPVASAGRPPADPIRDANRLYLDGSVDEAIEKLEGVPQISEHYDRAQALLTRWREEAGAADVQEVGDADAGTDAMASAADQRDRRLELARRAYDGGRYLEAAREFQAASRMAPLDGAAADLFEDAKRQLLPIRQQIALFRDREWRRGLPALWRIHLEDPGNYDAMRLLRDSYYNLGLQELQRADPESAIEHLKEIPELDASDESGARLLRFAQAYSGGGQDLLYRIFVGNLEFRK